MNLKTTFLTAASLLALSLCISAAYGMESPHEKEDKSLHPSNANLSSITDKEVCSWDTLRKSAKGGNVDDMLFLAFSLRGCHNYEEAIKWYVKLARHKEAHEEVEIACMQLLELHKLGYLVPKEFRVTWATPEAQKLTAKKNPDNLRVRVLLKQFHKAGKPKSP